MDGNDDVSSLDTNLSFIIDKLTTLSQHLKKMSQSVDLSNLRNETTGMEYSKFCSTIAFVLCSLIHTQHKLNGNDVPSQSVSTYLNRIKNYMKQIIDIQTQDSEKRSKVDKKAVNRIIKSSVS